jgi:hypothetical protein
MTRRRMVKLQRQNWAREGDSPIDAQWRARLSYQDDYNILRRAEWEIARDMREVELEVGLR